MKLQEGQVFSNVGVIDLGALVGDKDMNLYLIKMKIGLNQIAYHLDCNGKNIKFDAYPDICKSRSHGVKWDRTIFPAEDVARLRVREILSVEYPHLDISSV
jgi:hypothetical protein